MLIFISKSCDKKKYIGEGEGERREETDKERDEHFFE
jgi:hypothetical protein